MKKETERLIKWAMSLIADYRVQNMVEHSNFRKSTPAAQNSEIEIKNCKDFAEFLNSLPEIEEKLCFGGYIQDKNGTPCCQGDKVKYKDIPVDKVGAGTLRWNVDKSRFEIYWKDEDLKGLVDTMNIKTDFAPRDIEKVENDD